MASVFLDGLALAVALAAAALPAEDALREFRGALRRVEAREAAWWKEFPDAEVKAGQEFHRPLREQYAAKVTEPRPDFAPVRRLYEEALAFEADRAEACGTLAASGHPGTLPALWKEALAAADLEEAAEAANAPGALDQVGFLMRQGPSIRIHALARRRRALTAAFAAAPGAAAFLADPGTWKEARKRDLAARAVRRRVFLADALAALPGGAGAARLAPLLADDAFEIRIAALEGLAPLPGGPPPEAAPLLADPVPAVRFAALDVARDHPPGGARWIEALAGAYLGATGRLRADALRALRTATGQGFGDAPDAWKAWLEETRAAREAGTFRRPDAPAAGGATEAAAPGPRFWGIPVESDRVLVAADGWSTLVVPVDHELQATRHVTNWVTGDRGWRRDHESVQDVVARLLPPLVAGLPGGAEFRVLLLGGPGNLLGEVTAFGEKGPVPATPAQGRRAREFVEGFRIGSSEFLQQGLQSILDGREADTGVLVTGGRLVTDRFLLPEAFVEEFRRRNRFRRLRLHVVHVMDHGPESSRVLSGIAESSGGTLVRALVPPPR